jgi:endonuclease/exonuclease/phosphatase family metal-dependent hydrolase
MDKALKLAALLVMFWNLENFFYPTKGDNLAENPRAVTWKRFKAKRDLISKTIIAVKDQQGQYPAIIGLCEVENAKTLKNLIYDTPLSRLGYKILHKDSPDKRGIDAALLYREDEIELLDTAFLRIKEFQTRDILYAKLYSQSIKDTVHILVNHWPSKLGGEKKSLPRRMEAALLLKKTVDSIQSVIPSAIIIAMGDFNDSPSSAPVRAIPLNNLSLRLKDSLKKARAEIPGTHKYKGKWEMIDQFLVSKNTSAKAEIISFPHLLQQDKKYLGDKTRRTFIGPRFNAGASDHLPILLKLFD